MWWNLPTTHFYLHHLNCSTEFCPTISPPFFSRDCTRPFFSISGCSPHRSKLRVHVMVPPANPPRLLNPMRRPWLQRMAGFSMAGGEIVWLKKPRKNPRMKRTGVFLTLLRKEMGQRRVYLPRWSKSKIDGIFKFKLTQHEFNKGSCSCRFEPFSIYEKRRWDYGGFHENPHAVSKHSPACWAIRSPLHHFNILKPGFGWHKSNCCHRLTRLWDPLSWPTSSSYIIHFVFCLSVF